MITGSLSTKSLLNDWFPSFLLSRLIENVLLFPSSENKRMFYFHTLAHEVSVCDPITDTHQMLLRRVWLGVMEGREMGVLGPGRRWRSREKWADCGCVLYWVVDDSLEEGTATHSSILAWRIPWREEPGGL